MTSCNHSLAAGLGVVLLGWLHPAAAVDLHDTLLLTQPAVSQTHIAFIYDEDVWIADRDGSHSRRLTTAPGPEARPRFSPDGGSIAFSANYDGNVDVYLMPVEGGVPKRLTWHGGDDWMESFDPRGKIIFSSQSDVRSPAEIHLFETDKRGSHPTRLPIPLGNDASVSPDGARIAYTIMPPTGFQSLTHWKGYRGGSAARIAIMNFADLALQSLPQGAGRSNDLNPMWVGARLYFNSDRAGEFNLFSFEPASGDVRQLTHFTDFPVLNPTAGGGDIIFEQAGRLHLMDPATGSLTTLHIATNSDLRERRPRRVSGMDYIRAVVPSPGLERVAVEFRGEIVTVPSDKGTPENITRSPGANDRDPAWSPSGGRIGWFSDSSGEYELVIGAQDGSRTSRRIRIEGGAGFYRDIKWSPDERFIALLDNAYSLFVVGVETGQVRKIASNRFFGHEPFISYNWSPDSKWLAYTENSNGLIQKVHLYSMEDGKSRQITDGLTEVSEPVFDPDGRYLYVIASDEAGPIKDWFAQSSLDMTFKHTLYAMALAKDTPSPLPPENAAVNIAESRGPAPAALRIRVDFEGIEQRIVSLPSGTATLRDLQVGKSGELYYLSAPPIPAFEALSAPAELKRLVLKDRKATTMLSGIDKYALSRNGEKVLFHQGKTWRTSDVAQVIDADHAAEIPLQGISIEINPSEEWHQIAREAWRLNRDFFYAPNYHGVDWNGVWKKYEPLIDHAATRSDVERIIAWMLSELRVGHSYSAAGAAFSEARKLKVGLLGADYRVQEGRYQFAKVFGGLNWRPDLRTPLRAPGIFVAEGEFLLAVDGKNLTDAQSVYGVFEDLADRPVRISVGPRADGVGSRVLTVVPIANERELRYVDWVENNIRKVDAATGGRVAYVHVPDTSVAGHAAFKRYFYPQSHKDGIIIDDRNNGGGYTADYYIDTLRRQPVIDWATRYGEDLAGPRGAIFGPKVLIINEGAGSGGDLFPWMFRKFHLGPLVGMRTWGGLVGNLEIHTLMDGGTTTAPNIGGWTPEDGWVIENDGVAPDTPIDSSPRDIAAGRDPQLDKAIEMALQELKAQPRRARHRPPYPVKVH
jgi:tricorn protease